MVLPRKNAVANGSASSTSNALDPGPLTPFSELWGFLTQVLWEDGKPRLPGKITLSCDVDMLGLSLQDAETGQYAYLNGRSLGSLLEEAELRLADGSLSFRPSRYGKAGKR